MIFDTQRIIKSWHHRAQTYDALISRWPMFQELADRLIDHLPSTFDGAVIDLAGGSGLLSQRLLEHHPGCQVTLIEPAVNMCRLARGRLGQKVEIITASAEQFDSLNLSAQAVLCNVAFHLMDENQVIPMIAGSLKPGGLLAFNLWGHSFTKTVGQEHFVDGLAFVEMALNEMGESLPPRTNQILPKPRSLDALDRIANGCGLVLEGYRIAEHHTHARFGIEFAAMSQNFLGHLSSNLRSQVLTRALELCEGEDLRISVDLVFRKPD